MEEVIFNMKWRIAILAAGVTMGMLYLNAGGAAQEHPVLGYEDTPMLPGGKWHVHDIKRPHPPVVAPGTFSSEESPGKPPSDAIVLFDGTDLSKWRTAKGERAGWKVENGYMEVVPRTGDIFTRDEFGDCQIHVEWRTPIPAKGESQGRGNSGVFLFGQYEIQVLDSYENVTYADGQAGAIYGQYPPLVNASRRPGEWQVYDIAFTAPRFKNGRAEMPAFVTVFHDGILIHNHAAILGDTGHRILAKYVDHGPKGPLRLQDHGHAVRYRNVWVRPLKGYDEP